APALADKLAIAHLHFATHRDDSRPALDLHALKTVVVTVGMLRSGRQFSAISVVVDHEVRVTANGDRSLSRKKAEQLRCARAGRVDETVEAERAALHTIC